MVSRIELMKVTNGGWILTEPGDRPGYLPQAMAAYSDDESMLTGLAEMLNVQILVGVKTVGEEAIKAGVPQYIIND